MTQCRYVTNAGITYIKISKEHLDIETLEYYKLRWEYDTVCFDPLLQTHYLICTGSTHSNWLQEDPSYFIILQEMTTDETDVLFEHTRRRRGATELFIEERGRTDRGDYAFVRRRDKKSTKPKSGNEDPKKVSVFEPFSFLRSRGGVLTLYC